MIIRFLALFTLATVGCGSMSKPTPDPWGALQMKAEAVEDHMYALRSSADLLKRLVYIHARTSDCLELALVPTETHHIEAELEVYRPALFGPDRDEDLYVFISNMLDINLRYLVEAQAIVNDMFAYGEEKGCWPS